MTVPAGGTRSLGQYEATVLTLCLVATVAAALLRWSGSDAYAFIFGDADPVAVTLAISTLGVLSLRVLSRRGWYDAGGGSVRATVGASVLGVALTLPIVVVDAFGGFPPGINVPAPASLLFYPSIALVAELAFHAVPLALAALAVGLLTGMEDLVRRMGIGVAALIEPALQVVWGIEQSPTWANAYMGVHLVAFNVLGLEIFRRHGFLTVYAYRLAYYLIWHVAWGHARLGVLFGAA